MVDVPDFTSDLNGDVPASGEVVPSHSDPTGVAPRTDPVQPKAAKAPKSDAEPTAKPTSLRDQISSALKGNAAADTPDAAALNGGPARDATGKFAPKADGLPDTGVVDPSAPPAAAPVSVPPQALQALGMAPEEFSALPAKTQESLARTMEDINAAHKHFASLDQVEQLIAPRRQAWALNGMSESQALNQLLALSDFAGRDMPGFLKYMAENGGVNLEDLVFASDPVDPVQSELQKRLAAAEARISGFDTQQQQAAHNAVVNSVVAFASEKGADGSLLRPYFEELGTGILPIISAVKAQNPNWTQQQVLQTAYENACWATPAIRAKMQAGVNAAAEAERLRTEAGRVGKARAASVSVRSGAPSSPPASPSDKGGTLRDTIRASIASVT